MNPLKIFPVIVLCFFMVGCSTPLTLEQLHELDVLQSYWNHYVPNKHVAIKSLGQPDDTSYANDDGRGGYRRVVLTWFDVKTPDGRHWDKLSFCFYNYAPDYELAWRCYYTVIQPKVDYVGLGLDAQSQDISKKIVDLVKVGDMAGAKAIIDGIQDESLKKRVRANVGDILKQ